MPNHTLVGHSRNGFWEDIEPTLFYSNSQSIILWVACNKVAAVLLQKLLLSILFVYRHHPWLSITCYVTTSLCQLCTGTTWLQDYMPQLICLLNFVMNIFFKKWSYLAICVLSMNFPQNQRHSKMGSDLGMAIPRWKFSPFPGEYSRRNRV